MSNRDGNYEIYVMNVADALQGNEGSEVTRLTNDPAEDGRPSWSPDGMRIAFESNRGGNYDIYIMNVADALQGTDGSGLTRLTSNPSHDVAPSWSPDGTRIVFATLRDELDPENCDPDCNWEIYALNVQDALQGTDGSGVTRLTNDPAEDFGPTWSPDGTRIAFDSYRDGSYDIYVMNADGGGGGGVIKLTDDPSSDYGASWSPDGTRIAFTTFRDEPNPGNCLPDCNCEIYTLNVQDALQGTEGSGLTRLTSDPAYDEYPAWSPDGTRIAFVSWRDGNAEIYVMNADGSGLIRLTQDPADDWDIAWQPW